MMISLNTVLLLSLLLRTIRADHNTQPTEDYFMINGTSSVDITNSAVMPSSMPSLITSYPTPPPLSSFPSLAPVITQTPTIFSSHPSITPSSFPTSVSPTGNPSQLTSEPSSPNTSDTPSSIPSESPSFRTSQPSDSNLSNIPSSIPSRNPTRFPSTQPSGTTFPTAEMIDITGEPTLLPSAFPSFLESPSQEPSYSPSLYLVADTTFSNTAFIVQSISVMTQTDITMFEILLQDFIMEKDPGLIIYSVKVTMMQLIHSMKSRRLSTGFLSIDFDVTGRLEQRFSEETFTDRVQRILLEEDEDLKSKLYDLQIFDQGASTPDENKTKSSRTASFYLVQTFIGLGSTIAILAILVTLFMFASKTKSGARADTSIHNGHFHDPTAFPRNTQNEDEISTYSDGHETSTIESMSILDTPFMNENQEDQRGSNLSYSETSCDSGKDFMMSLTSSSLGVSDTKDHHQLGKIMHDIPLQEKRRPSDHEQDEDISLVETEIQYAGLRPQNFVRSAFTKLTTRNSFAQSDVTPKISNAWDHITRAQSTVSSLSDKSLYIGSISLNGEPYEVLVDSSKPLGLIVKSTRTGPQVQTVKSNSPILGLVEEGDFILSVDGIDTRSMTAKELSHWLHRDNARHQRERTFIFMSSRRIGEEWIKMANAI